MKRVILFLVLAMTLPIQAFCQTSKLPLWAAFPEDDTYVGFSFPGGGLRQAELSALTYYCILNGMASDSTDISVSPDGQMQISSDISSDGPQITLHYETVNSSELSTGETVALVRIGKDGKTAECQVLFRASLKSIIAEKANGEPDKNDNKAALVARFQTDSETETFEYAVHGDDYKFSYANSDGGTYKYEPTGGEKYKLCNSFPDKETGRRWAACTSGEAFALSFPASGLWSRNVMDILVLYYFPNLRSLAVEDKSSIKRIGALICGNGYCSIIVKIGD